MTIINIEPTEDGRYVARSEDGRSVTGPSQSVAEANWWAVYGHKPVPEHAGKGHVMHPHMTGYDTADVVFPSAQHEDAKYVVFKTDVFYSICKARNISFSHTVVDAVPDAVVIRRQDLFAGAALHSYANSIAIAIVALRQEGAHDAAHRLQAVSDYFHQQAVLADEEGHRIPD